MCTVPGGRRAQCTFNMSLSPTRYSSDSIRLGAPQPGFIVGRELQLRYLVMTAADRTVLCLSSLLGCLPCPLPTLQHPAFLFILRGILLDRRPSFVTSLLVYCSTTAHFCLSLNPGLTFLSENLVSFCPLIHSSLFLHYTYICCS